MTASGLADLNLRQHELLAVLAKIMPYHVRMAVLKVGALNTCLATSRVVKDVLDHYGVFNPRGVGVKVVAGNSAYRECMMAAGHAMPESELEMDRWIKSGARFRICGFSQRQSPDLYNGHVVTVAGDWIFDLSCDQFSTPQQGYEFDFVVEPADQAFARGVGGHFHETPEGNVIVYGPNEDQTWDTGLDWVKDWGVLPGVLEGIEGEVARGLDDLLTTVQSSSHLKVVGE